MPRPFGHGPGGPWGPGPGGPFGPVNVGSNYFRPGGPNRPALGGHVEVTGQSFTDSLVSKYFYLKRTFSKSIERKGIIGGIFLGARYLTSGSLRYDSFVGKIATYDKQLSENRITENQCKERKMMAARTYYRYLRKIGYLNQEEYVEKMNEYAKSINVNYVNDSNQQTRGRSR